jgi:tetratricopeptide (TPR) repeat protein
MREALRHAERAGDARLLLRLRIGLIYASFSAGRFREALEACERTLADAARSGTEGSHQIAYARLFHAMLCVDMGRPADARADLDAAADVAWCHADADLLCQVYGFAPVVARMLGVDASESLQRTQRAVELAEYLGSPFARVHAYWGYGVAHLLVGEAKTACKILNGVLLLARDHGVALHGEAGILADLALATLARGEGAVALSIADEAVEAARTNRTSLYECIARLARVQVLLETRGAAVGSEVEGEIARVRSLIAADGTIGFEPLARMHLAALARLRGDQRRSDDERRAARALFASSGASGWATRIDASLAPGAAA